MWAIISEFKMEEWLVNDRKELRVKFEGMCDVEQMVAIAKELHRPNVEFEIRVKKSAEAIGDERVMLACKCPRDIHDPDGCKNLGVVRGGRFLCPTCDQCNEEHPVD